MQQGPRNNTILSYSFDSNDKINQETKNVKRISTSNCIYDGTGEALTKISEEHPECLVLVLCYNNKEFDIKSDDPMLATDTQIGCITSSISNESMNNDEPSIIMTNVCINKIGNLQFNKTTVMHKSNNNYVISTNVKDIVNSRDFSSLRTRSLSSNSPNNFNVRNSNSPNIFNSSSPRDFRVQRPFPLQNANNNSIPRQDINSPTFQQRFLIESSSPRRSFNGFSSPKPQRGKKTKATGIIYGDYQDMHYFLCNYVGNRQYKNRKDITKLHVIPIAVLIEFIGDMKSQSHHKINIWVLLRINKWVKEDASIEKPTNDMCVLKDKASAEELEPYMLVK
jgi:hypothetical protein